MNFVNPKKLFCAAVLCAGMSLFAQEEIPEQTAPVQPVPVQPAPVQPAPPPAVPAQPAQPSQPTFPAQPSPPVPAPPPPAPAPPSTQPPPAQTSQPAVRSAPGALQNYRIGRDLEAKNRFDEANTYYNEAIRLCIEEINRNQSGMDSYTILTWALLRQRKYADVISWGDRALRINANDYRIVETMGEAYFFLNDYEHSLMMMQRYVASMPRGDRASTAYFFMGEIYRNRKKYLHADIAYTTAVTLEGSIVLWWFRLGMVREAAGEYEQAIEAYEKALVLNPNYREAAEALERTKRLNAAAPQNQG